MAKLIVLNEDSYSIMNVLPVFKKCIEGMWALQVEAELNCTTRDVLEKVVVSCFLNFGSPSVKVYISIILSSICKLNFTLVNHLIVEI